MILCSNPKAQYLAYKNEIDDAVSRAFDSGWYILGEEVQKFEEEFARYIGVSFGVGVGSGTEAIHLALSACGIEPGDEVITVSHTAVATVAAIEMAGAKPVMVDIEPDFYTIDPEKIELSITSRTKAIIPVHIYGQSADMAPVLEISKKYNLRVIEDCSQSHGAIYRQKRTGSLGDMSCFSFYPTKNLGAIGDGGIVVTNSEELARQAKLLREYGWTERHVSCIPGRNTRLDEIQAAILRVKLKYLDNDNSKRVHLAGMYNNGLCDSKVILPKQRINSTHVYHLYVVRSKKRDELLTFLKEKGIRALIHYPVPVHLQPAYRHLRVDDKLPETEKIAREALSLPIYPELSESDIQTTIKTIMDFTGAVRD